MINHRLWEELDKVAARYRQLRAWSASKLNAALTEIAAVIKACRQTGALDETLTERLLLRLAFMARGKG